MLKSFAEYLWYCVKTLHLAWIHPVITAVTFAGSIGWVKGVAAQELFSLLRLNCCSIQQFYLQYTTAQISM